MNEMIGNQYFICGKYHLALKEYEATLKNNKQNLQVSKKLILCYIKMNQIYRALDAFERVISQDIEVITNNNEIENCICKELIAEFENFNTNFSEEEIDIALGILWLFCNKYNSIKYFNKVLDENPNNQKLIKILNKLIS